MGLRIWFDEFELKVGDSLRRSIDYGLSKSRFGIVILSPYFFAKEWTQKELDALTARETKDKKIILPIWHNISAKEIRKYSPLLADRFAIDSTVGVDMAVDKLLSKIRPATPKSQKDSQEANRIGIEDLEKINSALQEVKQKLERKEAELQSVLAHAHEVSHTDGLTFLPNRRQIMVDLINAVAFSDQYDTPLTISMLDIDNFKHITDTYGYIVGDNILRSLAEEFRQIIRHPNIIGRYGGEVFLIIFPQIALNDASEQVKNISQQIHSKLIFSDNYEFHMTVSIGLAQYKIGEEDWQKLLERADQALYQARNNGLNQSSS